jgi:hypothetical protein
MTDAVAQLVASRQRLREQFLAARPGPQAGVASEALGVAAGLGMGASLAAWLGREAAARIEPAVQQHPLLAVGAAVLAGAGLVRLHWPRALVLTLATRVLLPRLLSVLMQASKSCGAEKAPH